MAGLIFWKFEDTFEDVGHDQDKALKYPRILKKDIPDPKVIWGHESCILR